MEMCDETLWRCPGPGSACEVKEAGDALALFSFRGILLMQELFGF